MTVQDDKAQFTFMEGVVAADANREAWLRDKSTNTKMVLHEGDDLKYAGFNAVVLSIGNDFLLMQQADETLRLNVGQNLRQSIVIAKLDPPKDAAATTTEEASTDSEVTRSESDTARPAAPPQPENVTSEVSAGDVPKPEDSKPEQPEPAAPRKRRGSNAADLAGACFRTVCSGVVHARSVHRSMPRFSVE